MITRTAVLEAVSDRGRLVGFVEVRGGTIRDVGRRAKARAPIEAIAKQTASMTKASWNASAFA